MSYSTDLFSPLLPALRDGTLSPQDRLGLLNDAFALVGSHLLTELVQTMLLMLLLSLPLCQARAGVGSTTDVLRLFPSYVNETSYTVWENLVGNLSILDRLLSYTDCYEDFRKFAAKLFAPTAVRLGWDPKDSECKAPTVYVKLYNA